MAKVPMTRAEINNSTQRKLAAIQELMRSLEVTVEAREQIDNQGYIKKIVFFNDHEDYQIKEEPKTTATEGQPVPAGAEAATQDTAA